MMCPVNVLFTVRKMAGIGRVHSTSSTTSTSIGVGGSGIVIPRPPSWSDGLQLMEFKSLGVSPVCGQLSWQSLAEALAYATFLLFRRR